VTTETQSKAPGETIHATALVVGEAGILIKGAAGAGKSSTALALLSLAPQRGHFARLIGDDRVILSWRNGRLIARGHKAISGMIEQRGEGIIQLPYEPAAVVRLVVDLLPAEAIARVPDSLDTKVTLYGVKLPRLALSSRCSGYDRVLIILNRLQRPETI
jgi:serine kinase of HPr protein (carbohydrate metabolism regulator)